MNRRTAHNGAPACLALQVNTQQAWLYMRHGLADLVSKSLACSSFADLSRVLVSRSCFCHDSAPPGIYTLFLHEALSVYPLNFEFVKNGSVSVLLY